MHAPPPSSNAETTTSTPGRYSVGTLTYSIGGLVALFVVMMLGDFAWSMKERAVPDLFQVLLRRYHVSDLMFGALATAVPAAITVVLGPLIGVISDNYRSRLGRRIPFLIITTPVVVLATAGLAAGPTVGPMLAGIFGGGEEGSRLATVTSLALCWAIFEAGTVIANGIFTALVNDVVPQAVIGRFYGLFRLFSLLAGILFNFYLFKHADGWYAQMFLGIAALYGLGFGIMCWFVREGQYPAPVRAQTTEPVTAKIGSYLHSCLGTPYYAMIIIVFALAQVSSIPINAFSLKSAEAFGLDNAGYGNARAITYTISLFLAFPIGWMTDIFHPMRTGLATQLLYGILMISGYFLITDSQSFQIFFVIHGVLSGAYFTAVASLLLRLLPRERFSQMAAAAMAANCLLVIVASLAIGRLLDILDHNYRVTFLLGGGIAISSVLAWCVLYRQFNAQGGVSNYVPPES